MKLTRFDVVTIALVVIVPVAAYLGYFKGRIARLSELRSKEAELEQQTANDHQTAADIRDARQNVRRLQERLDRFFGSVTGQDEAYKAVDTILQSAKEAGVRIEAVRPSPAIEGQTLNCLPISLTASAEFSKLYDFLRRVERSRVIITVHQMELGSDPVSSVCSVNLELRVYFAKPTAAGGTQT